MSDSKEAVRIGCGSGYSRDPPEAAAEVAEDGDVSYLCCDRLAERTLAYATRDKYTGQSEGYNPLLEEWFTEMLPVCDENDVTIIGNFGAANPEAAGEKVAEIAEAEGCDLKIAAISGDSVIESLNDHELAHFETGEVLDPESLPGEIVSANAYLGAEPIVEALRAEADVIIGGRISDHSLFLGPLVHEFGWSMRSLDKLAAGTTVGHLLECGVHTTGGNHATPGYVDVPGLENLPFPLAEVYEDGDAIITKPSGTDGVVDELSVASQLVYEIHDPADYKTPDVNVDLRNVTLEQVGDDRVKVTGASGKPKPDMQKVLIGVDEGYVGELEVGWGGKDSRSKADLTISEVVEPKLAELGDAIKDAQVDRIGVDSVHGPAAPDPACEPNEVRLRIAVKTENAKTAEAALDTLEPCVFFAASGGGGLDRSIEPQIGIYSTLISRDAIDVTVDYRTVREGVVA